jgi:hypothetical protein
MPMRHEPFCSHPRISSPHALLISHCGADGAAALSVPMRDNFQSAGWTTPPNTRGRLRPLLVFIHFRLHQRHAIRSTSRVHRQQHSRSGERAHRERLLLPKQDSSQESVFSASQLFHLLSPHSATSPQASDLGNDSDGTAIAAGLSKDGSGAATRASALTRGQQQRMADVAAQDAFLG